MNYLPVRPLLKYSSGDGAWMIAQKAEQRKQFKAIICALKTQNDDKIKKIINSQSNNELKSNLFSKEFIFDCCKTVDPSKVAVINVNMAYLKPSTEEFFEFTSVFKIEAAANYLNLDCFTTFLNLTELNLSSNNLKNVSIDPKDFHNLEILDVSFNDFTVDDVLMFGLIRNLKKLSLCGNDLNQLPEQMNEPYVDEAGHSFYRFTELVELNLEKNNLSLEETFASLAGLIKLKVLKLAYNRISSIPLLRTVYHEEDEYLPENLFQLYPYDNFGDDMEEAEFTNFYLENPKMEIRIPSTLMEVDEEYLLSKREEKSVKSESNKDEESKRQMLEEHTEIDEDESQGIEFYVTTMNTSVNKDVMKIYKQQTEAEDIKISDEYEDVDSEIKIDRNILEFDEQYNNDFKKQELEKMIENNTQIIKDNIDLEIERLKIKPNEKEGDRDNIDEIDQRDINIIILENNEASIENQEKHNALEKESEETLINSIKNNEEYIKEPREEEKSAIDDITVKDNEEINNENKGTEDINIGNKSIEEINNENKSNEEINNQNKSNENIKDGNVDKETNSKAYKLSASENNTISVLFNYPEHGPDENINEKFKTMLLATEEIKELTNKEIEEELQVEETENEFEDNSNNLKLRSKIKPGKSNYIIEINKDLRSFTVTETIKIISMDSQGENQLKPFPSLEVLDLSHNRIKDEKGIIPVISWVNLTKLSIHDNPLTLTKSQKSSFIKELLENAFKITVDWIPAIVRENLHTNVSKSNINVSDILPAFPLKKFKVNPFLFERQSSEIIAKMELPKLMPIESIISHVRNTDEELVIQTYPESMVWKHKSLSDLQQELIEDPEAKMQYKSKTHLLAALKHKLEHPITYFDRNVDLFKKQDRILAKNKIVKPKEVRKIEGQEIIYSVLREQSIRKVQTEISLETILNPDYYKGNRSREKQFKIASKAINQMQKKYNEIRQQSLKKE